MSSEGPQPRPPDPAAPAVAEPLPVPGGWPSWPGWVAILIGIVALFGGLGAAAAVQTGQLPAGNAEVYAAAALVGALLLLAGLAWLAVRALRLRRFLPIDRYRGPSVFVLLFLVLVAGNLLAIPFVTSSLIEGEAALDDPLTLSMLLVITPLIFAGVTLLFVVLPSALPGLRLTDGDRTLPNLLTGLLLGVPTWVAAALVGVLVALTYQAITGSEPEGQQLVLDLLDRIPPVVAFIAVGILAPVAEELFFRGAVFNAWEREYGLRRAVLGSALLFAVIHLIDGAWLAFAPILVVGLVLAGAYARTRSLPMVIGIHAGFNIISTALIYLAPKLPQ